MLQLNAVVLAVIAVMFAGVSLFWMMTFTQCYMWMGISNLVLDWYKLALQTSSSSSWIQRQ